ncbi:MAG: hypothetical protein ACPLSA_06530, partial [Caldanaerobacter sp.]
MISFLMLSIFSIVFVAISFFSIWTLLTSKGSDALILNLIFIAPAAIISSIVSILAIIVLLSLPHMRYELRDDALYLIMGPWSDKISYNEIIDVSVKDLVLNPLSSFRMPGV